MSTPNGHVRLRPAGHRRADRRLGHRHRRRMARACRRAAAPSQQGKELFDRLGAKCHGAKGEGGDGGPPLVGGIGSLNTDAPLKTVGSYWPYATDAVRLHPPRHAGRQAAVAGAG